MLDGVNDSPPMRAELVALVRDRACRASST
jgi:hypothetical protein